MGEDRGQDELGDRDGVHVRRGEPHPALAEAAVEGQVGAGRGAVNPPDGRRGVHQVEEGADHPVVEGLRGEPRHFGRDVTRRCPVDEHLAVGLDPGEDGRDTRTGELVAERGRGPLGEQHGHR